MDKHKIAQESNEIVERYARRDIDRDAYQRLYASTNPAVYMAQQERERAVIKILSSMLRPLESLTAIEIGCGTGGYLAELIKLGFRPENLSGIDLLEDRIATARHRLPATVSLFQGDALTTAFPQHQYDVIYVSTVFSSILDSKFQALLASRIWSLLKPGGLVLWYDFIYNNPKNKGKRTPSTV